MADKEFLDMLVASREKAFKGFHDGLLKLLETYGTELDFDEMANEIESFLDDFKKALENIESDHLA